MGKNLSRLFCCTVCAALILAGVLYLGRVTGRKESVKQVVPFFSQEEDFDVLFFGASHSELACFPMELWADYGIVSYNLSSGGTRLPITYWQLVNAFNHSVPKLAVIDCCYVDDRMYYELSHLHDAIDGFPLCVDKVRAVYDLVEPGKRAEFIFPFFLYHSRWKELTEEDFAVELTKEKGARSFARVAETMRYDRLPESERTLLSNRGFDYLRKSIEYCKSRGVEVLLTCIPFPAAPNDQNISYTVSQIAEEYGVRCLDLYTLEEIVDYTTDMDDTHHLNALGGKKISKYIGQYIVENYDIPDQRENPAYSAWNEDYAEYLAYKAGLIDEQISGQGSVRSSLMLLNDKDFSCALYLKPEASLYQDEISVKLLATLGLDVAAIDQGQAQLLVVDNGVRSTHILSRGDSVATTFGELNVDSADGEDAVLLDGELLFSSEKTAAKEIVLAAWDASSGKLISAG